MEGYQAAARVATFLTEHFPQLGRAGSRRRAGKIRRAGGWVAGPPHRPYLVASVLMRLTKAAGPRRSGRR
jgi:hypothetical protein